MRITRLLPVSIALLAALVFPSCAHPQRTESVAATRNVPSATPLQILDDFGQPITESQIRRRMKRSNARWIAPPLGAVVGSVLFFVAAPKGPSKDDCSVYEPCSDREEFYRGSAAVVGAFVGAIFSHAVASNGPDRFQAIERIRAERRSARR